MEVRLNVEVNQIIRLIRQMPQEDKLKIMKELDKDVKLKPSASKEKGLTELLLSGPVMSEKEKENFKKIQQYFDLWTKTEFA
jgi:hypothetical protein